MKNFSENFGRLRNSYRVAYLIREYLQKNLSVEEGEELDQWMLQDEQNMQLFEDLTDEQNIEAFLSWYTSVDVEKNLAEVKRRIRFSTSAPSIRLWKYAAAACAVGILGFAVYYLASGRRESPKKDLAVQKVDIEPGSRYAILKLADGKTIELKRALDTVISEQVKVSDGELVYSADLASDSVRLNELIIPRKGFYKLVLPDGTKVWLNSESSIKYPIAFDGPERAVSVTGETYFDVAHDASKPFVVSANGMTITALGTAFDINAYPNEEDFRATLIRGKIKVNEAGREEILKPNQQLRIKGSDWKLIPEVETGSVTAWTDNQFRFKDATIGEIMRQVERWYDVKVEYVDQINYHFNGTIDRSVSVSHLLHLLEETGNASFELRENEILVKK